MELDERKLKILQAIVSNYIETAEPVGSRTISKHYELGVSPATIRNEMSDLEELGFIVQPHTSAGRVPSDKGYRFYIDQIVRLELTKKYQAMLIDKLFNKMERMEIMLQNIAKVLADTTNYATIVTTPSYSKNKIKSIQIVSMDANALLLILITDTNVIKNHVVTVPNDLDQKDLNKLAYILNNQLYGRSNGEISLPIIETIKAQCECTEIVIDKLLKSIYEIIKELDKEEIYTSGATNILKFPEFNDVSKAVNIIHAFEEKDILESLLKYNNKDTLNMDDNVKIMIGDENQALGIKDCSLITTTYRINEDTFGTIGIIGPKRMDYTSAVFALKTISQQISKMIDNLDPTEDGKNPST